MNNILMIKKSMAIMLTLVALLSLVTPAIAQENRAEVGKDESIALLQQQGLTDPTEMEAFLDGLMKKEMEEYHIAGAAISVVKDGRLLFTKGYGYADIEKGTPVDLEQTIFRIGSVTKLFTATAVMQLVEQRR